MVPDAGFKSKNAPDTGTDTVVGPDIRPARFPVWSDSINPACHIPVLLRLGIKNRDYPA